MHIPSFLEALQPLVREAGNRIMAVYAMDLQGNSKADGSPVTLADQAAESVILEVCNTLLLPSRWFQKKTPPVIAWRLPASSSW